MVELARQHDDLPAMMALVRNKISKKMNDIVWKIQPCRLGGQPAGVVNAGSEQFQHRVTAPAQCSDDLITTGAVKIDARRRFDGLFFPDRFDPTAPAVMNVVRDHADGSARLTENFFIPQICRKMFDEKDRRLMVRLPGVEYCFVEINLVCH